MKDFRFSFPNLFALIIWCSVFWYFIKHPNPTIDETYKNILLIVSGFIFGSSLSSKKKDDTIQSMQEKATDGPVIVDKVDTQNITLEKE